MRPMIPLATKKRIAPIWSLTGSTSSSNRGDLQKGDDDLVSNLPFRNNSRNNTAKEEHSGNKVNSNEHKRQSLSELILALFIQVVDVIVKCLCNIFHKSTARPGRTGTGSSSRSGTKSKAMTMMRQVYDNVITAMATIIQNNVNNCMSDKNKEFGQDETTDDGCNVHSSNMEEADDEKYQDQEKGLTIITTGSNTIIHHGRTGHEDEDDKIIPLEQDDTEAVNNDLETTSLFPRTPTKEQPNNKKGNNDDTCFLVWGKQVMEHHHGKQRVHTAEVSDYTALFHGQGCFENRNESSHHQRGRIQEDQQEEFQDALVVTNKQIMDHSREYGLYPGKPTKSSGMPNGKQLIHDETTEERWNERDWFGVNITTDTLQVIKIRIMDPYDGYKGVYTGTWSKSSGMPHGRGRMEYASKEGKWYEGDWNHGQWTGYALLADGDGNVYEGDFKNDQQHGTGVMRFLDGRVFEGEYIRGQMIDGKMTHPDGTVYRGSWEDGKLHGWGKSVFVDGSEYEGEYLEGTFHGHGQMTWNDGGWYVGEWSNGEMHGRGKEIRSDGSLQHDGEWSRGRPIRGTEITLSTFDANTEHLEDTHFVNDRQFVDPYGEKGFYTGAFSKSTGMPNGQGRLQYEKGGRWYEGDWCHGRWSGYGRLFDGDGYYEGGFNNDHKHGTGVMRFADGRVFEGEYVRGQMIQGKMTYQDGSVHVGWLNGIQSGQGHRISEDGKWPRRRRSIS